MTYSHIVRNVLVELESGRIGVDDAVDRLGRISIEDLGDLKLDHGRGLRTGNAEAVFGPGKTPEQIERAISHLSTGGRAVLATRLDGSQGERLLDRFPHGTWHATGRVFEVPAEVPPVPRGRVMVVTGGTGDVPVAEEATVVARSLGARVETSYDVGVAGIHRVLEQQDRLRNSRVVVVVAGMEGALASVVGGMVPGVVIAVPTSVGYGTGFGGLAALLSMLNSCAPGVLVTNIDNGYGAGVAAARINALLPSGAADSSDAGTATEEDS